jgi:hypothetical protein
MADALNVNSLLKLTIDGITDALMFHKFDPPTLKLENLTHNTWDDQGNPSPGSGGAKHPISGEWGIERVLDANGALFQWFKDTNEKGRTDETKKDCTVAVIKVDDSALHTWNLQKTSIISYTQAGADANANSVLTESVRLYSETIDITF